MEKRLRGRYARCAKLRSSADIAAMRPLTCLLVLLATVSPSCAFAGGGPLGIDHLVTYDDSGIWKRSYQKDLALGAALTVIGGAFLADNDSRIGHTFDQSLDSMVLTAVTTTGAKYVFSRPR